MNPHTIQAAQLLAERSLLFCSRFSAHPQTPFLRSKALALSLDPADPALYLELRVLFENASGLPAAD